ncbi:MAG: sigma-70 family RNA polymerase sigma factor [Planctomycetaceae bacterium]|nr:sigma-70 family RNA polymerase sigma factor [Planctomycetaceae bacterium]
MNSHQDSTQHDPLLDKVRQGDTTAFAEYLERERPRLTNYVTSRLGAALRGKLEAGDIVQDVCLDAVQGFTQVDFSNREPFGWLCHIVERKVIDAHRRLKSQKRGALEVPLQGGQRGNDEGDIVNLLVVSMTSPSQAFSRNRKESRMFAAVAELPPEQQTALRLRYVQGLSSNEVAQEIGKSPGATRVLLSRALAQLRDALGEDSN